MTKEQTIKYLVVPVSVVLIAIITVVLVFAARENIWRYYLIGGALGLLTHGFMIKSTARITRMSNDPTFNARKSAMIWMLIRMVVVVGVFVGIAFLAKDDLQENDKSKLVVDLIVALAGYMTVKIIFLLSIGLTRYLERREAKME